MDRNILAALSSDGRLSMAELSHQVGLSKTPVQARVRRLEKDGYIRGYQAIVDRERMGEGHTVVLVSHDEQQIAEICDRVLWIEHGKSVLQGERDIVFEAYHRDMHLQHGTSA